MNYHTYYKTELDLHLARGDVGRCIELFEDLIGTMPSSIKHSKPGAILASDREKDLAYYYSLLYHDLGGLYKDSGNESMAGKCYAEKKKLLAMSGKQ